MSDIGDMIESGSDGPDWANNQIPSHYQILLKAHESLKAQLTAAQQQAEADKQRIAKLEKDLDEWSRARRAALGKYIKANVRAIHLESELATVTAERDKAREIGFRRIKEVMKLKAELAALREQYRWVSVSERLPDESKRGASYPCQYHYRHSPNQVFIHEQPWGGTHWWVLRELIVTKWFDLPAPDAEDQHDEAG